MFLMTVKLISQYLNSIDMQHMLELYDIQILYGGHLKHAVSFSSNIQNECINMSARILQLESDGYVRNQFSYFVFANRKELQLKKPL